LDSVVIINVLANDLSGVCALNALNAFDTIANSGLHHGTLKISATDSTFTYETTGAFIGVDSVDYYIKCGADSSAARVYILKQQSLALQYIACQGALIAMGFEEIPGLEYYWYDAATGGNLVKATASDTIRRVKDATDVQSWWVEPRYHGVVFPRYQIDLLKGDCEVIDPDGCAKDGTVIWKENFDGYDDGNNPASPAYSTEELPAGMTTYTFVSVPPAYLGDGLYNAGTYGLVKDAIDALNPDSYLSHYRDDHTSPGDATRGRFLITNGRTTPDRVYTQEINNLCSDMNLYFSFWLAGSEAEIEWTIYETPSNKVLAKFKQNKLPGSIIWKQYGFKFPVPTGVTSIRFEIYNYCDVYSGNDVVYDDIEVRFCAPPVELNVSVDTTVCTGNEFKLIGTYADDGTFGGSLAYRWEYHSLDNTTWNLLGTQGTSGDPLSTTWKIDPVTKADEGYYRLIVSTSANINNANCRAVSDSILVKIGRVVTVPDIRIDICPSPAIAIRLSSFLDSLDFTSVQWTKTYPTIPNINATTGEINTGDFTNATFTYRYSQESQCDTSSAIAYVHPLKNNILRNTIDTIVVCTNQELSQHVQLNQIFGLEFGSELTYPVNPNNIVSSNVRLFPSSGSIYSGARIFNAFNAWKEANDPAYDITYKGDTNAKKFVFKYTAPQGSCIEGQSRTVVIVVTENMF
jgi:hypothetical protein